MRTGAKVRRDLELFVVWFVGLAAWASGCVALGFYAFKHMWVSTSGYYYCTNTGNKPLNYCHSMWYNSDFHWGLFSVCALEVVVTITLLTIILRNEW